MSEYYDRSGKPITLEEWRDSDRAARRVALDKVGEYEVSTVWLGLDHQFGGGPPLIFETMIFGSGPLDNEMRRYSTEAEALAGHAEMVKMAAEADQ